MKYSEPIIELESITMIVDIEELEDQQDGIVNFSVGDLDTVKINLSDSDVNDVKAFYDKVFDYIVFKEKLIEFQLRYEKSNLFFEVASDIVDHLNYEIKQSEDNFKKIITLNNSN